MPPCWRGADLASLLGVVPLYVGLEVPSFPLGPGLPCSLEPRGEASGRIEAPLVMASHAQSAHYLQINIADGF